jgi:hypothetical protein
MFPISTMALVFGHVPATGAIANLMPLRRATLTSPIKSPWPRLGSRGEIKRARSMRIKFRVHPIVLNFPRVRQNGIGAQNHINHPLSARAVWSAFPILSRCLCTTREMLSIPPTTIIPRNSRRIWAFANAMSSLQTMWVAPIKPFTRGRSVNRRSCRWGRGSCRRLINRRIFFRAAPTWPFIDARWLSRGRARLRARVWPSIFPRISVPIRVF